MTSQTKADYNRQYYLAHKDELNAKRLENYHKKREADESEKLFDVMVERIMNYDMNDASPESQKNFFVLVGVVRLGLMIRYHELPAEAKALLNISHLRQFMDI